MGIVQWPGQGSHRQEAEGCQEDVVFNLAKSVPSSNIRKGIHSKSYFIYNYKSIVLHHLNHKFIKYSARIFDEFMVEVVENNALVVVDEITLAVDTLPDIAARDALGKIEHNILLTPFCFLSLTPH